MQKRVGAGGVAWAQGQKRSGDEAASRVVWKANALGRGL